MINLSFINDRISEVLKSNKTLSQKGLAQHLEKGTSTISLWLSQGRDIPADCIIPICDYLSVSIEWLLGLEKKSNISKDEQELLEMFKQVPYAERKECIAYLQGYIARIKYEKTETCRKKDA